MTTSRIEQLIEMLKSDPDDSFLNYALALEHTKTGDVKKAIEIIEALLLKDPGYLGAYYQLGKFYEIINDKNNAVTTYTKGITVAQQQKNRKALGELNEALMMLEE